ncbi:MAG: type VI secretion system ImpA family N-terminal domain-containing protein, partial [Succinivibrionaceae bacterium]|nr:type VI secretion system ImpA family N-terminal domain-containing protein [Succinivibrionaceae bacterium]
MTDEDIQALMAPLPGDSPAGENLEYDPMYMDLETLATGTPDQQMGDSLVEGKDPDWRALRANCEKLCDRTRDLRVGCYLTIANTAIDGLPGLARSLRFLSYLVTEMWDTVYPQLDPDDDNDPTERVNVISMISPQDGAYNDPIQFINRLRGSKLVDRLPYTLRDLLISQGALEAADKTVDSNIINAEMMSVGLDQIEAQHALCTESMKLLGGIQEFMNDKMGDSGYVRLDQLNKELKVLDKFYSEHSVAPAADEPADGEGEAAADGEAV